MQIHRIVQTLEIYSFHKVNKKKLKKQPSAKIIHFKFKKDQDET